MSLFCRFKLQILLRFGPRPLAIFLSLQHLPVRRLVIRQQAAKVRSSKSNPIGLLVRIYEHCCSSASDNGLSDWTKAVASSSVHLPLF